MLDFTDRIITHILNGNVEMIKDLLDIGFLDPEDTILSMSILQFVARKRSRCATAMIDMLLSRGIKVDYGIGETPLEGALQNNNYEIAAYLQERGGTFDLEIFRNHVEALNAACLGSSAVQTGA